MTRAQQIANEISLQIQDFEANGEYYDVHDLTNDYFRNWCIESLFLFIEVTEILLKAKKERVQAKLNK